MLHIILVILLWNPQGIEVGQMEFKTIQACQAALVEVNQRIEQSDTGHPAAAFCTIQGTSV